MSAPWSRRSRAALAVIATGLLVGIVMPVAVSGERIVNPDYVGKGRFDRTTDQVLGESFGADGRTGFRAGTGESG
jgi:hypothetical protein